jgi:PhnB protein
MNVNTHLNFGGNCRAAFDYYAKVFGSKIEMAMTWGESPMKDQCSPAEHDKIIHIAMKVGETMLMGADAPPERFEKATGITLAVSPKTADEANRLFAALSDGGSVTMPIQATFWSPAFGMCTDRFGMPWMVSAEGQQ